MTYAKLFRSILHSSVWQTDAATRLVWITMLALADRDGLVEASVPGLADAAKVSLEECERALGILGSPDKWSSSPAAEGRRILVARGGWQLVNYDLYRLKSDQEETRLKNAERQKRFRARRRELGRPEDTQSSAPSRAVTPSNGQSPEATKNNDKAAASASPAAPEDHLEGATPGAKPKRPRRSRTTVPRDFAASESDRTLAQDLGVDVDCEVPRFVDHFRGAGTLKADWPATFRNWLRRASEFQGAKPRAAPPKAKTVDEVLREQHYGGLEW